MYIKQDSYGMFWKKKNSILETGKSSVQFPEKKNLFLTHLNSPETE
jgi:hypothetical protein